MASSVREYRGCLIMPASVNGSGIRWDARVDSPVNGSGLVPHAGDGFTSLYWTRCDAHTPPNREGTFIMRDGRGWEA